MHFDTYKPKGQLEQIELCEELMKGMPDDGSASLFDCPDQSSEPAKNDKKKGVVAQLLDVCMDNEITDKNALARFCNQNTQYRFLMIMQRTGAYSQVFETVKSLLTQVSLYSRIHWNGCRLEDSRIWHLLTHVHGFKEEWIKNFILNLFKVVERKSGKRNVFAVIGKSNSGKSQLMETFVRAYFGNCFGTPTNNPRSGFPWGNCINCRVLLWEEPYILDDNYEDFKKIGGGQATTVDVKYQSHCELEPTPVIVTSNKPLTHSLSIADMSKQEEVKNRCYTYTLNQAVPDDKKDFYFPLCKQDWDDIFSVYKTHIDMNM